MLTYAPLSGHFFVVSIFFCQLFIHWAVSTEIDNSVNRRNSQTTFDPAHIFLVWRPGAVGLLLQPVKWYFFTFIEVIKTGFGHPTYFGIGIYLIG